MNIKEFLNSPGITIKNPNKKSKKDNQPSTITLPFDRDNTSSIYSQANEQFDDVGNMLTDIENPLKYENHGITLTRKSTELRPGTDFRNLDFELADAQSNWTKAGNALAQTVVDEIIGGTIQGFSDMAVAVPQGLAKLTDAILDSVFDIKGDKVQDALGMKDEDYSNPVSAKIQEWRDKFKNDVAPIYTTPGVSIDNGGFGDFGWWMSNMPSIMSSITLLIPTRAATIGVGKLAGLLSKANTARKATRAINKAVQAEKLADAARLGEVSRDFEELNALEKFIYNPITRERLAKGGRDFVEAGLMRTIENYQEAHQTYQDTYAQAGQILGDMSDEDYAKWVAVHGQEFQEDGIDINDKDAVAKHIATKAADRTFAADYTNVVFDFIQLHSLRDVGRIAKKTTSPSIKRMHRMSKAIAGKTDAEVSKIADRSFGTKLKENFVDFTTGAAKSILSEASEGVEEGINYIAQQEGITYGNTLLSLESDNTKGGFWNTRLSDYLYDSEFWESAFWGVAGGVVFGEGMNAITKGQIARETKKAEKRRAQNDRTGEQTVTTTSENVLNDFIARGELPEVKAAKEAIARRTTRANQLAQDLKLIEAGKNPNIRDEKTGEPVDLGDSPIDKELAKRELIHQFRTDLAFDALNSGTYDLLIDYLNNENVKQMFVNAGATTNEEMNSFIQETIQDMEVVKRAYNEELAHVNHQVTALNANKPEEGKIPLEYVSHIARINAVKRVKIAGLERQISALEAKRADLDDGTEYGGNALDAKGSVRFAMLMDVFGRLEADKKALNDDTEIEEWAKAESLKEIKNQQDAILNAIVDTASSLYGATPFSVDNNGESYRPSDREHALGAALKAIRMAKAYKRVGNIYQTDYTSQDYQKTDEELMAEYDHVFSKSKSNASILGQIAQLVEQDVNDVAGTGEGTLYNANKRLYDLYTNIADLEIQRAALTSQITRSQSQIQEHVDIIHNRMNAVRREKLKRAEKTIRDIHSKYITTNARDVERAVISSYMNDREEATRLARENLTGVDEDGHSDAEKLLDALAILNFSAGANQDAFTYIMALLRANAQKHRDSGEISTTFQQPISAPQSSQPNNSTSEQQNSLFGAPPAQIDNIEQQETLVTAETLDSDTRPRRNVVLEVQNGNIVIKPLSVNDSNNDAIVLLDNGNGEFELAISALPKEKQAQYLLNPNIFEQAEVDSLQQNIDLNVATNPIVVYDTFNRPTINTLGSVVVTDKQTGEVIDTTSSPVEGNDAENNAPAANEEPTTPPATTSQVQLPQSYQASTQPIIGNQSISSTGGVSSHLPVAQQEAVIAHILGQYIADNNLDIENITDWDAVRTAIRQAVQPGIDQNNFTAEEIESLIDDYINDLKDDSEQLSQLEGDEQNAGRIAMYARYEEPNTRDLSNLFKSAVESFIEEFGKHFIIKEVNGKPAIRVRDIMNACNQLKNTADNAGVDNLYNAVVAYLMSEEGQQKYAVLDAEDVRNGTVLSKVGKSAAELRAASGTGITATQDIKLDITNILRTGDAAALRTLNSLKPGDKLTVSYIRQGSGIIEFKASDGTVIGTLHVPRQPDPSTRNGVKHYRYHTDDWMMDVGINAGGHPVGALYDLFQDIFFNTATQYDNIRQIIATYAVDGDIVKAANSLSQNPVIQQVVQQAIQAVSAGHYDDNLVYANVNRTNPVNYQKLIIGLHKVWAYTYENGGSVQEMRDNLEAWFLKAYHTYDMTLNASQNISNVTAEVAYNPDGEVNLVVPAHEQNRDDAYDKMPLVGTAIASGTKAFVGIADRDQSIGTRIVTASDSVNPEPTQSWTTNSTILSVIGPSGKPQFVKAFGVRLNDTNIPQDVQSEYMKLMGAFSTAVSSYFNAIATADTQAKAEVARTQLMNFLRDTIAGTRIGLFRVSDGQIIVQDVVYRDKPNVRGIEISWLRRDGSKKSFQIITSDRNGTPKLGIKTVDGTSFKISNTNDAFSSFVYGFLSPNFQFDISKEGIMADAGIRGQQRNSVFTRGTDGKLTVTIKHPITNQVLYQETYNSYSEFLIKNNLLRVNTKKENNRGSESNFAATNRNQRGNQMVMVRLGVTSQVANQPIAQQAQSNIVSRDADEETFDKIKEILPQRNEVYSSNPVDLASKVGRVPDILKIILGTTALDEFNQIAQEMGIEASLFPEQIMYDPEFNRNTGDEAGDGFIAATNTRSEDTRYTQYGTPTHNRARLKPGWVVVGNKLLNMLSSTSKERRNRGITKLIHERLHQLLSDPNLSEEKREAFKAIKELYNIYRAQLSADIAMAQRSGQVVRLNTLKVLDKLLKNVTTDVANHPERENEIYEEFMVEAMTNNLMYEYLNQIKYNHGDSAILDQYDDNSGKDTLFTKIMDFIARLFGWNKSADDSLNKKFYQVLRTLGNSNHVESEASGENLVEDDSEQENDEVPLSDEEIGRQEEQELEDEILDVDDDDDFDPDLDSDYATVEEVSPEGLNNPITGLDVFRKTLPSELQPNFDSLVDNGYIELICK